MIIGLNRLKRQGNFFDSKFSQPTNNGGNQQPFPFLFGQPSSFSGSQRGSNDWFRNYLLSGQPIAQAGTGISLERSNRGDPQVGVGRSFGAFQTGWQPGLAVQAGPHNPGKNFSEKNEVIL